MAGEAAAQFEIALRFADGRGVPANERQAAHWLELAAKQGLVPAQFRLGGYYEKGIGVKKDLAAARELYLAAAAKGNGKAMHNLAVLYAEGVSGRADYRTAALWFRKAADRGVTDSQYNLGVLYARGTGTPLNYTEAYKWFALAAKEGDVEAARKRDEMALQLDDDTLAAADLEDDDGLATIGGAVERGHEPIRLPHALEEHRDHVRGRVVDQVLEDVGGHDHRLVARRDHPAPAEAPAIGQKADDDGAAL